MRFKFIAQFTSSTNRHIIQESWLFKTRNHLEKFEKKQKQKNLRKLQQICKDTCLYFACLTRFHNHGDFFFVFKHQVCKFSDSFVPDFESIHYFVHLNNIIALSMNDMRSLSPALFTLHTFSFFSLHCPLYSLRTIFSKNGYLFIGYR